jgi:dynein heavy chain
MDPEEVNQKPTTGVYIYGLFIEGCRWNRCIRSKLHISTNEDSRVCREDGCLEESVPLTLYEPMPVIWLDPIKLADITVDKEHPVYNAPLYKVSSRAGTLSTTGHSTNFVRVLDIPAGKGSPDHWVSDLCVALLLL